MSAKVVEEEKAPVTDLSNPAVTDKYREAAKIANFALNAVIGQIKPGSSVVEVCEFGDALIEAQAAKAFKASKVEKGIAFPTCLSINNCVGHFSPLKAEDITINAGDAVKIDLGVHIDGFIAVAAHTIVVGAEEVTGPQADVIAAAYTAAEVALRLIKPGNTNTQVTAAIADVAKAYGVTPVQGVLMHQMKQSIIDGPKVILLRGDDPEVKVEEATFEPNEVYSVDIVFSTGEGKPREMDARTTVYKLGLESSYQVKMKASKFVINEAIRRFGITPFTVRALGDEKEPRQLSQALLGVSECVKHGLLHEYPVLYEKEGAQVAHFKFTVLLLPGGTLKIAGLPAATNVKSDKEVPAEIKAILATEPYVAKKKVAASS